MLIFLVNWIYSLKKERLYLCWVFKEGYLSLGVSFRTRGVLWERKAVSLSSNPKQSVLVDGCVVICLLWCVCDDVIVDWLIVDWMWIFPRLEWPLSRVSLFFSISLLARDFIRQSIFRHAQGEALFRFTRGKHDFHFRSDVRKSSSDVSVSTSDSSEFDVAK